MNLPFTLRQLQYFEAIAREGSLAAAAETSHVSATALSLALDELERHLAVQLFVRRKGRGLTLSPEGARLLTHVRQLLSEAESLAAEASEGASGLNGRFVIGCFAPLTPFFLPGVLDGLRHHHPLLAPEIVEASAPELHEHLLQARVDAAVLYGVDVSPQLDFEPLQQFRPYVIVAENHRLAGRGSVSLKELVNEPLIQLDLPPSQQNTERLFALLGLSPAVRHVTSNYELARCLVGRGHGYSVLVQRPASTVTYDGHAVTTLELSDDVPPNVVGIARPKGAPRTAKFAAVHDLLKAGRFDRPDAA